jgi:hypothetical protein
MFINFSGLLKTSLYQLSQILHGIEVVKEVKNDLRVTYCLYAYTI